MFQKSDVSGLNFFAGFVVVVFEGEGGKYMPMIQTSNSPEKNSVSHFLSIPRVFSKPPGQFCIHRHACVCVCVCVYVCVNIFLLGQVGFFPFVFVVTL